jgi:RimJ/RimL family protein N-acetyltransferase
MSLERDWPLFGLRIETPRLSMTYPRDEDLGALNLVAAEGIHDRALMPFDIPWTDAPPEERPRNSLQYWWGLRAGWRPRDWHLVVVVRVDGHVVGAQDLLATDFAVRREVTTGSWLGQAYQGRGIGKEMRAAMLHLAFAGLGADRAVSAAFETNAASLGVSRALGYVDNGVDIKAPRGVPMRQIRLLLTRQAWEQNRRQDIQIQDLEPCLAMFGADEKGG